MSNIEDWIRSKVGCGYVYGATGWVCSPARRQQQADQYPKYADNILGICAKWDGKECFDCAQLIRRALESVGVTGVPSGATSQWNKKALWTEYGTIDTLPPDGLVALSRESPKGSGTMQHIGWRLSDGTVIDARSSYKGVIISRLENYNWTHWMRPALTTTTTTTIEEDTPMLYRAIVTTESGSLNVRVSPVTGRIIGRVPRKATVEVLTDPTDGWCRIRYNDIVGYASTLYLTEIEDEPAPDTSTIKTTTIANADGTKVTLVGEWRVTENA